MGFKRLNGDSSTSTPFIHCKKEQRAKVPRSFSLNFCFCHCQTTTPTSSAELHTSRPFMCGAAATPLSNARTLRMHRPCKTTNPLAPQSPFLSFLPIAITFPRNRTDPSRTKCTYFTFTRKFQINRHYLLMELINGFKLCSHAPLPPFPRISSWCSVASLAHWPTISNLDGRGKNGASSSSNGVEPRHHRRVATAVTL